MMPSLVIVLTCKKNWDGKAGCIRCLLFYLFVAIVSTIAMTGMFKSWF